MNRKLFACLLLTAACAFHGCQNRETIADYNVIPLPGEILLHGDEGFRLNAGTPIFHEEESTGDAVRNAGFLAEYIEQATGFRLRTAVGTGERGAIVLRTDPSLAAPEGYHIEINPEGITVTGGSAAGVFYGIQTLRKAISAKASNRILFPSATITDAPRLPYRGMMLDVARSFYDVEQVKRFIDLLPLHNLNVFHWHLTDDQGWRIEIKQYPRLTEIGSVRADTTALGSYGGYYTQEQVREVVEYARERYITVIPEIDMPGHVVAALAAYPGLGCTEGPYKVTSQPGVRRDILCAGNPEVYRFVEEVLLEVIELFPSSYIHIGGDEVPRIRWEECPKCQAMIRIQRIKAADGYSAEARLQGYFNHRIEDFLALHGRRLIGWDEIIEGGLSPQATVMSWRGTQGGIVAATAGHDVIMSPNSALYFDYYQSKNFEMEPLSFGALIPLQKVYDYDPAPDALSVSVRNHIIGAQANLWSTWMRDFEVVQYMALPRMAALAENAWSRPGRCTFEGFMNRLDRLCAFYARDGYHYKSAFFAVDGTFTADHERSCVMMTLTSLDGADIFYTLDGSTPTAASMRYTDPVAITGPAMVRALAILPGGRQSEVMHEQVVFNKATFKPIRLLTSPEPKYSIAGLNDGIHGKEIFTFGNWVGYQTEDLEAVIDLLTSTDISSVTATTLLDYGSHIMEPSSMAVWLSEDGMDFTPVAQATFAQVPYQAHKQIFTHKLDFDPLWARYVKVKIERSKELPLEYFDARSMPFLFVDEIAVD